MKNLLLIYLAAIQFGSLATAKRVEGGAQRLSLYSQAQEAPVAALPSGRPS